MRRFLLLLFLIIGAGTIYSFYASHEIKENNSLLETVNIPFGQKDIYEQIDSKYQAKYTFNEKSQRKNLNKQMKQSAGPQVIERDIEDVLKEKKTLREDSFYVKNKVITYVIQSEHLVLDLAFFNDSNLAFEEDIQIKCELLNNGVKKDIVSKNGSLKLKPKEKILFKKMDFGFINYVEFNQVQCSLRVI